MSLVSLPLLVVGFLAAVSTPVDRTGSTNESPAVTAPAPGSPGDAALPAGEWIASSSDNICGLRDLGQLSNPARVDHPRLLKATPELKRLRDEKIDPNSPEGIQLREKAVDRVRAACEQVRRREGNCSVWRAIRNRDGRQVPDLTGRVLGEI